MFSFLISDTLEFLQRRIIARVPKSNQGDCDWLEVLHKMVKIESFTDEGTSILSEGSVGVGFPNPLCAVL